MFKTDHSFSTVTAILPVSVTTKVASAILDDAGSSALTWQARGTLLHDHWWKRWFPPISPAKSILQMLIPDAEVDHVVTKIVENGKLHQQAMGAVFSTPCEHVYFGSEFHIWPVKSDSNKLTNHHGLTENLSIIYCIVGHSNAEGTAKAAINAGAHGPVVYYSEGRGLRDRLGWLRITKEHEKEVLMVITDEADADNVFDAMAKAGALHLPGRGFMYRCAIDKGLFNLPSRISHHHYDANLQQIISAIDHLTGHSHWRDQSVFNVGVEGRAVGIDQLNIKPGLKDQVSLSAVTTRSNSQSLMDMMLDAGAPGLNITYARFTANDRSSNHANARLNEEYGMIRCITDNLTAERICQIVETEAEQLELRDLSLFVNAVPQVATYIPEMTDKIV